MNAFSPTRLARMHTVLARHVESGRMPGLVAAVSRGGEVHATVLGRQAFDGDAPMRRDTIFRIASLTKPITAAAALTLIEDCTLRLDDPVDKFLPELADRKVLARPDAPLGDTVPARRSISLRDLLTFRFGLGLIMSSNTPIERAMAEAGVGPGPDQPTVSPDEYMRRLGTLPLAYQPGERWLYHTGSDVLGVLLARAAGQSLETVLRQRILDPLGMRDTSFQVPADQLHRLPGSYRGDPKTGAPVTYDDPANSRWRKPPLFASGGGGLVSTADDMLAFGRMLLAKGRHGSERILSRPAVELMTSDRLTPESKVGTEMFLGTDHGWGFGVAVRLRRENLAAPGLYGWAGGYGTCWACDPAEDLVGVIMTQRLMESLAPAVFDDFWTCAYQALDD